MYTTTFLQLSVYGNTIEYMYKVTYINFIVGTVTDGEFNSLRTQGAEGPIHLWQVIHDARESVSRQRKETLMAMLIKIGGKK